MKKIALLLTAVLLSIAGYAAPVTVWNSQGTLHTRFKPASETGPELTITELKVTGSIDARDIYFIRENLKNLTYLELAPFQITSYTGAIAGINDDANTVYQLNYLPKEAFRGMDNLRTFVWNSSDANLGIDEGAFRDCSAFTTFTQDSYYDVTSVGAYAFAGTALASFTFAKFSDTSVSAYAFAGCTQLESVVLNNTITAIGEGAFSNCTKLASVQFSLRETLTEIGDEAFKNTGFTTLSLPEGLVTLGKAVLYGANKLTRLELPSTLTTIDKDAFKYSEGTDKFNITDLYVYAENPPVIDAATFNTLDKTNVALRVPAGKAGDYRVAAGWDFSNILSIPNVVTNVTAGTLSDLIGEADRTTLLELNLTGTINKLDFDFIKSKLPNLKKLDLSGVTIAEYREMYEDYLYDEEGEIVWDEDWNPVMVELERIYPADGIPYQAFRNHALLKTVVLPEGLTSIGEAAFGQCRFLVSIGVIPTTVTEIGGNAFQDTRISSIEIPAGVEVLRAFTFNRCHNLTELKLNQGLKYFENNVIYSTSLQSLVLPEGFDSLGTNALSLCTALESVTFTDIRVVGEGAFQNNYFLKELNFPEGLEKIGEGAFVNCDSLEKVSFPSTLKSLDVGAFRLSGRPVNLYTKLKAIYSYAVDPALVEEGTFAYINVGDGAEDCTLYVPEGATMNYYDKNWMFLKVVEMGTALTGVSLDKATLSLKVAETGQLTAVFAPADATNKNVVWSSSNEPVATVDADGLVTAIAVGEAVITVTTEDGGHTASCTVTVEQGSGLWDAKNNIDFVLQANPVSNEARFSFESAGSGASIAIVDLTGKTVATEVITSGATEAVIAVDNLTKGIYIAKYSDGAGKQGTVKLVK